MDIVALVEQGASNPFILMIFAMLLGALHGLEPGHSKTMMAAFVIAVRGTVGQAVLLGLSAAVSHSIIVWVLALFWGNELIGEVGELVCAEPLPSMPLYFWGDEDGSRLHDSYFDTYPGIWRHGDWIEITPEGGSVIYGRSDATINRRGLRLGSSEIYRAVEGLDEVMDSLVIDLEFLGRDSFMVLFVVPKEGPLTDALRDRIKLAIREAVSARFLPDEIVEVADIPRTLSGKKLEVPVKKLLLGHDPDKVVNRDSMANPDSFDQFLAYAATRG